MIQTPTVLVLGAGASVPYGFPSGKKLKKRILDSGPKVHEDVGERDEGRFLEFQRTLRHSAQPSVDAFLEHRSELMDLGKALIAHQLIAHENTNALFKTEDWYQYLWQRMGTSFDEFDRNQLSIITFNYDRSLEHFLFTALVNSYRVSGEDAAEKLKHIPIIHVYGQLGLLEWQGNDDEGANVRPYGHDRTIQAIRIAARGIQILTEGKDESDKFQQARDLVHRAKLVYFLGFGYNTTNMKRLQLPVHGSPNYDAARYMAGSCYSLTEAERKIIEVNEGLRLGHISHTAHEFLRNEETFLRS